MEQKQLEAETPEPSDDEEEEVEEGGDPVLLLSQLYPEAPLDVAEQQEWHKERDWTMTVRTLQPLNESELPWIAEQRDVLGDELPPDYTRYDPEHLKEYPEQRFAFELVKEHADANFASEEQIEPLPMVIDGAGGCGKSHVLHCIVKAIVGLALFHGFVDRVVVRICAPTGAAASLVYGGTLHSFIWWNPSRPFADFKGEQLTHWQEHVRDLRYLLIDERSLVSGMLMGYLLRRLRQGRPFAAANDPFAGVSIILFGDDFQLPPTNGGRLYDEPFYTYQKRRMFSGDRDHARRIYMERFTTCVQLVTNVRAKGASAEQASFRALQMECLRPCRPTEKWWKYLKQADIKELPAAEQAQWRLKFRLCSTNDKRLCHNIEMLGWISKELREPIATIHAEHPRGGRLAAVGSPAKAQGLILQLSICVGAWVTFNWNGWVSRGIVNGLSGIVLEIVYMPGTAPPTLPLVVFVACAMYRGDSYDKTHATPPCEREDLILGYAGLRAGQAGVVAVQPISRTWDVVVQQSKKTVTCERKQLPLDLAFAKSIHKGQGMSIGEGQGILDGVLDLGETELELGLSYVGVSRFMSLSSMKIIYPMWGRFERIGARLPSDAKHATLQRRATEAVRIEGIVAATKDRHAVVWERCIVWAAEVAEMIEVSEQVQTDEAEERLSDAECMAYVQSATDCCICTALADNVREIPFDEIIKMLSKLLVRDGWCGVTDHDIVGVEESLTSLVREQHMYPSWMLDQDSFHLHHLGDDSD